MASSIVVSLTVVIFAPAEPQESRGQAGVIPESGITSNLERGHILMGALVDRRDFLRGILAGALAVPAAGSTERPSGSSSPALTRDDPFSKQVTIYRDEFGCLTSWAKPRRRLSSVTATP